MANSIADQIGEDDPLSTIATTLFAYAFSSVLTGEIPINFRVFARFSELSLSTTFHLHHITPFLIQNTNADVNVLIVGLSFFLLGALKLGTVVGFFPRHILVGYVI